MVLGAIVAVCASQLIGALWYSPYCLGNLWMKTTFPNRSRETIAKQAGPAYAVTLVAFAGIAVLLHFILVDFFKVKTVMEAIKFSVGLASLTTLVDASHLVFSQRNLVAYLIDHLFDCVCLVVMSACIFYISG